MLRRVEPPGYRLILGNGTAPWWRRCGTSSVSSWARPIWSSLRSEGPAKTGIGVRSGLIIEKVAIDMGAWIKDARSRGYEKVILVGWSGGGSLSLFYQAKAATPSVTATLAGDPVDLTWAGLEPADGVIFIAAHLSRAETLTEWLDPSVTDELDPDRRALEFDIYNSTCPNQPR